MSAWNDFWSIIHDLFTIPITWDVYTVAIIFIYVFFFLMGYYLISQQIKLIKAEVFSTFDYIKCVVYGFILASSFILIAIIIFLFAWKTQPWFFLIPMSNNNLTAILLFAFSFTIIFLFLFPIFDLLYTAHSKNNKGLTPFQEFIANKILHRVKRPFSYLCAICIYFVLYILPLIILIRLGFPSVIAVTSIAVTYPVIILNYFGVLGYISGVSNAYYKIPVISRVNFLYYAREGRFLKDMIQDKYNGLIARVFYGLQVFFIFWICISLITTLQKMTAEVVTPIQTFLQWQVFISLFFGFTGYFTRFWARKIKFRTMDVLFSGWLVAVTGLNVMINYIVSNSGIFTEVFQAWSFTRPITFTNTFVNGDFLFFCPIAVVEEITILILTFYYLLEIKNDHFFKSKFSIVETASHQFKPIPLFNLIRVSQDAIRNHAKEELLRMYERLPYRNELNLLDNYFMNPIFDAVCDWNKNSKEMGLCILQSYFKSIPEKISTKINQILYSYNYDKKIPILQLILENKENILRFIKIDILYDLLSDKDYQVRLLSIKLLLNHPNLKNDIRVEKISNLLNDPEFQIQAEALQLIVSNKIGIDPNLIFLKIDHSNQKIKSAAILSLVELGSIDLMKNGSMVELLLNMLNTVEGHTKVAIIESLAKIGNFKKNNIPFKLFLKGLYDNDEGVKRASAQAISFYLNEQQNTSESFDILKKLIEDIQTVDDSIKVYILKILGERWEFNPEIIVPIILDNIKSRNKEIQSISSQIAVSLGNKKPQLILKHLLMLEEEVTYLKRGIVSETISKIFEKSPNLVKLIIIYLENENETVRINVASSLSAIVDDFSGEIDIGKIINSMMKERSARVKKELIKFISGYGEKRPELIVKEITQILKILKDEDPLVRISALKMLIPIAKIKGVIIPFESIIVLLNDSDSSIRESAIKVIRNMQGLNDEQIKCIFYMMKELLNDRDWSVRNAAIDVIKTLGLSSKSPDVLNKIFELLDSNEKYTKIKALEVIAEIAKTNPDIIPLENKIKKILKDPDSNVRGTCTEILGYYDEKHFELVFPLIIELMMDKDELVREHAQNSLVNISARVSMSTLLPKTLQYFSDETNILIQQSMALALKRVLKYENKAVKKRLIDILKIRCEISQDHIICQTLQELLQD